MGRTRGGRCSRLTYGHHTRDYSFTDSFGVSDSHNRRDIVDWHSVWKASPKIELVGGANAEWSSYTISGSRTEDRVVAGYLSTTAYATEQLTFNAGVRYDDYRSAGSATTGRAGAAWLLNENRTKLRATIGTGFTAPGSDDRYGVPQWGTDCESRSSSRRIDGMGCRARPIVRGRSRDGVRDFFPESLSRPVRLRF